MEVGVARKTKSISIVAASMSATRLVLRALLGIIFLIGLTCSQKLMKYSLLMPDVYPDQDETYFCTSVRIVDFKNFYIVGFEPNATMDVVHHMLVFGCTEPGTTDPFWDCGEMASDRVRPDVKKANPCADGSNVIYAWALNAKPLTLPDDVGFHIGQDTPVKYLVMQIHYSKKFINNQRDRSGLNLIYTEEPQSKLAGVLLMATGGVIPPGGITHMETFCSLEEDKTIYPFAYRTHTHQLGRVVSGYAVRRNESHGVDHWALLGKRDPRTPQMFYPIFDSTPITKYDKLAARCTMDSSSRTTNTYVGPRNENEMCNFYLMYYVDKGTPLDMKYCVKEGPPTFYWRHEKELLNNIPDEEASSLD